MPSRALFGGRRLAVHARRAGRSIASARPVRRAARIVGRALVFGLAPSIAGDALVDHVTLTETLVMHSLASNVLAAAVATGFHDIALLLRKGG
jgi:hypothetical protein